MLNSIGNHKIDYDLLLWLNSNTVICFLFKIDELNSHSIGGYVK